MSAFLFRLPTSGTVSHLPDTLLAAFNRCGLLPDHRGPIYWALPDTGGWATLTDQVYISATAFSLRHPTAVTRGAPMHVIFAPLNTPAQIRDAFNAIPY